MIIQCKMPTVPESILNLVAKQGLIAKKELHLTVVPWWIKRKYPVIDQVADAWFESSPDAFAFDYQDLYYFCQRRYDINEFITVPHTRMSIVQAVRCNDMMHLYSLYEVETPFPHVTLFVGTDDTNGTNWDAGISLLSTDTGCLIRNGVIDNSYQSLNYMES